jgi:Ca2+/Na+ antiporter
MLLIIGSEETKMNKDNILFGFAVLVVGLVFLDGGVVLLNSIIPVWFYLICLIVIIVGVIIICAGLADIDVLRYLP